MKELADTLASRRTAAFNRAKAAVDSPRYHLLLLDTLQWLENGDWAKVRRRQARLKGSPRKFLRAEPRRPRKKRRTCANSIPDSITNCGSRARS
jgi:CHAD domain-containing protein